MTAERRAELEAAGHTVATPEDFFNLDEADRAILDLRIRIADEVRRLRKEQNLSQRDLAARLDVAQSRVAGIEKGKNASLDTLLTAYLAVGGELPDFGVTIVPPRLRSRVRRPPGMATAKTDATARKPRKLRPAAAK